MQAQARVGLVRREGTQVDSLVGIAGGHRWWAHLAGQSKKTSILAVARYGLARYGRRWAGTGSKQRAREWDVPVCHGCEKWREAGSPVRSVVDCLEHRAHSQEHRRRRHAPLVRCLVQRRVAERRGGVDGTWCGRAEQLDDFRALVVARGEMQRQRRIASVGDFGISSSLNEELDNRSTACIGGPVKRHRTRPIVARHERGVSRQLAAHTILIRCSTGEDERGHMECTEWAFHLTGRFLIFWD